MKSISIKFAKSSPLSLLNNFQWNEQKFHLFTKNAKFWDLNEGRGDFEQIEGHGIRSDSNGTALI